MAFQAKQKLTRFLSHTPVYRAMPPGGARMYAALKYLGENGTQDDVTAFIRKTGGIPVRHLPTALVAVRAVFRAGADDVFADTVKALEERYPDSPDVRVLKADAAAFAGDNESAFQLASDANELRRNHGQSMARVVSYGYRVLPSDEADAAAVEAVTRFPRHDEVLWTVAKLCERPAQFEELRRTWLSLQDSPASFLKGVRQLATAAGRVGDIDAALDLYRIAFNHLLDGHRLKAPIPAPSLEGKNPWSAFEDLTTVLDQSGIPYFLAAGTVLGLVREGRPLSTDNDIDVGILDEDFDQTTILDLFKKHPRFDFDVVHPKTKKIGLRHRGGSPIDIFRFYREAGQVWHDAVYVRWHNSPFEIEHKEFRGLTLPVPANVDKYLTENYGDWRVPRPDFDPFTSVAPNVETTWPEYMNLHFVRRAYRLMSAGAWAEAATNLRLASEETLATQVEDRP